METKTITCESCDVVVINNHICHEYECPDIWKDYEKECLWCGTLFKPELKHQECCDPTCDENYYG